MKVLTRRPRIPVSKAAGAARKGVGGVFRRVQGIARLPKIIGKRRMTQALMAKLNAAPEYSPVDITRLIHRPGNKTYGYRAVDGFHIEVVNEKGWKETIEERHFNRKGLLTRLILHIPNAGRYIWDYRTPGQWRGREQGTRPSRQTRALDKLRG